MLEALYCRVVHGAGRRRARAAGSIPSAVAIALVLCACVPAVAQNCPFAHTSNAIPQAGTVDARQPYEPGVPDVIQGIGGAGEAIVISLDPLFPSAPASADIACWTLCETGDGGLGANEIVSVSLVDPDTDQNTFAITLARAITPGEATVIQYLGSLDGEQDAVIYRSHPGNANGDNWAFPNDVLRLIDFLNGVSVPTFGVFGTDIDRNGVFDDTDVDRLIDLLQGTNGFDSWVGTPLPDWNNGCTTGNLDIDLDGVPDEMDNCVNVPNGPDGGTCLNDVNVTCTANADCDSEPGAGDGVCSLNQEDSDEDCVGDVCDCAPADHSVCCSLEDGDECDDCGKIGPDECADQFNDGPDANGDGICELGPMCGDGVCDADEDCSSCAADCGVCPPACGDGACNAGEDCASCEADCGPCGGGGPPCDATETAKLVADDAASNDRFGSAVSVSGDVAVIGALEDNDTGSAYIFRRLGAHWVQESKLLAADGAAFDQFGFSVSISGDVAVIGAPGDDDNAQNSGSAYVFRRNGTVWIQESKLLPDDDGASSGGFGVSVSISGDVALIGAPGDDDNGINSGSAYVFRRLGPIWIQVAKLLPDDGSVSANFGVSVSASEDIALIGAWSDNENGTASGSAYVFRSNGTAWDQEAKLVPDDGAVLDFFGTSVSLSGDVAVIGATHDDDNGFDSGSAYIFRSTGVAWVQEAKLLADDGAADDQFGGAVSVSGDVAVIGATGDADNGSGSGSAYVFRNTATGWTQQAKLLAADGMPTESFGKSVSASGNVGLVGASGDDHNGLNTGSAYVFAGLGDCNTNGTLDLCDVADGTSDDADGNGIPDECQPILIVSSDPPDGAIDARQPSEPDGTNPAGWGSIVLTFNGDATAMTPEDFTVIPDFPNAIPFDVTVKPDGDTVTLTFLDPGTGAPAMIPPGAWTVITHLPSGSSTRLGYLPADVINDGIANAVDILQLIDDLNGVIDPPLADYQTDTDRSGTATATDILRVIDLLNGAGAYDVWNGATLPE